MGTRVPGIGAVGAAGRCASCDDSGERGRGRAYGKTPQEGRYPVGWASPTAYYDKKEFTRLDGFFTYVDQLLASKGQGPVVYIRMSDATKVW
jgi:hypothetical protein